MAERKSFLVRLPPWLLEELNRWAGDELRSINAQIEYILREAVRRRRGSDKGLKDTDEPENGQG